MELFVAQCPWWLAGLLIAAIVVGLQWTANLPLGATGAVVAATELPRRLDWRLFLFAGIALGALIHTLVGPGLHPTFANGSLDARVGGSLAAKGAMLVAGGVLMGFGARAAGGCTSGHGMCGLARAQASSLISTMTFMAAAVAVANLVVRL
jgi:uncharacterized membrane protein YedE/YeeE